MELSLGKVTEEELFILITSKLESAKYNDPTEHLYDAMKVAKIQAKEKQPIIFHDLLLGLESDTIGDFDGIIAECCFLIRKFRK